MYHVLLKILDCAECRSSCVEKGICDFSPGELPAVLKILSRIYKKTIDDTLDFRYGVLKNINKELALRWTLATVGLAEIAEFLEDEDVEDVALIPGRPIYVTRKRGKENSGKMCEGKAIRAILKIAHLKSVELSTSTPSLRYGLKIGPIRLRISLDLPPIVPLPQAYLRIHRGKITLAQLLRSGFLTEDQLREIYRWVREGRHIVVTGPPGSGKTTLLSALDDLIPGEWQRVYIDEADEFEDDPRKNQIKIRNVNKVKEIYASLNRNIDVIFIGELQYEDHFAAFKTATEIGLQTLATMHSVNIDDAVTRLRRREIDVRNIGIVQLGKRYAGAIERRVVELYAE
ncbi:ATPase, T2SS/T4P/T4SS family [Pyrobaculum sp. 3827-6]|uniref:ATPase, T2SS/T4P/T4SS family n=1 Tax=Pyrobaculum sp. 3827-6 TaxID=2983604 RepID=UPI0021D9827C|nr:ATPase, T2SS/T4P/T4SS family [Pyrobaculum sp. 3827-6]MCU7786420.1 ATPase, T2SS/T4P/T4SS family [Pyrobaculum sp. 3827-6]